eukprot:gene53-77_t
MIIKKYVNLHILLLATLICSVSSIDNSDECVFDASSITDDFLKQNKNIQSYIWSAKDKQAHILLKNGDYVFVAKWACSHYGMKATKISMLSRVEEANTKYWQKDMLSFGEQFLWTGDFEAFKSVVEKTDWTKGGENLYVSDKYKIDIPHWSYPEYPKLKIHGVKRMAMFKRATIEVSILVIKNIAWKFHFQHIMPPVQEVMYISGDKEKEEIGRKVDLK